MFSKYTMKNNKEQKGTERLKIPLYENKDSSKNNFVTEKSIIFIDE